jgi:hypothetical protein
MGGRERGKKEAVSRYWPFLTASAVWGLTRREELGIVAEIRS